MIKKILFLLFASFLFLNAANKTAKTDTQSNAQNVEQAAQENVSEIENGKPK